jgi:hypothetical protein
MTLGTPRANAGRQSQKAPKRFAKSRIDLSRRRSHRRSSVVTRRHFGGFRDPSTNTGRYNITLPRAEGRAFLSSNLTWQALAVTLELPRTWAAQPDHIPSHESPHGQAYDNIWMAMDDHGDLKEGDAPSLFPSLDFSTFSSPLLLSC